MAAPSGGGGSQWRRPAALEGPPPPPRGVGRPCECLRRKAGLEARLRRGGFLRSPGAGSGLPQSRAAASFPRCFPAPRAGRQARAFPWCGWARAPAELPGLDRPRGRPSARGEADTCSAVLWKTTAGPEKEQKAIITNNPGRSGYPRAFQSPLPPPHKAALFSPLFEQKPALARALTAAALSGRNRKTWW